MGPIDTTRARGRAAIVAVAPAVLLAGFVYHPFLHHPTDPMRIAAAAADTTRWGIAHLAVVAHAVRRSPARYFIRRHAQVERWMAGARYKSAHEGGSRESRVALFRHWAAAR